MEEKRVIVTDNITDSEMVDDSNIAVDDTLKDSGDGVLYKTSKFWSFMLKISSILCVLSALYLNSLYVPEEREMDTTNLFCNNSLIVDDSTAESICLELEEEFDIELDEDNDNSLLLNAIYCNKNLSDEDKLFCIKYLDLFNDNPYIDKDRIYYSLLNLDISNKNRPPYFEDNVEGVYLDDFKSIGIFVEDEDSTVKAHELIHCVCANDGELATFFKEGMTELLTNEYFTENHFLELDNYPFEVYAVKMLCDTAGADAVLKSFTTGDMTFVYESLSNYYGSVDDAKRAVDIFEDFFLCCDGKKEYFSYTIDDISNYLFGYLHNVAFSKYGDVAECGDLRRASFFYNEVMLLNLFDEDVLSALVSDLEVYGVLCNPYFSSKLKMEYPEIVVSRFDDAVVINQKDAQKIKLFQ